MSDFPIPGRAPSELAVAPPDDGDQRWAGAPTARLADDGAILLAYRTRGAGGDRVVVARSGDGVAFEPLVEVTPAAMVERAALTPAPGGGWRLYVSCAEPGTKNWYVALLEASTVDRLDRADPRPLALGGPLEAVKDPVVQAAPDGGWRMWACVHHLDVPGAEDRMSTAYATSVDGVSWAWHGTVLRGRPGRWDARGARVTAVLPDGRAAYDGRATAEENWFEKVGLAEPRGAGLVATGEPVADVRYLDVLALPGGGHRIYYEARRPDGAHELRTERQP